ncbi:DUF2063 domain-containing protein [Roseateles sp. DAIF2]|uniref:HvfC/BufC N-terminal domain-containing protein n=1 Tax=Roseateles sp. DAIF2 TaxID=2714952 RepID=UPI0018A2D06C|nr:DNA-binding domain-containing protein [Roseateles sp. DAIF2]QPF71819.1 DUF2063 domain-containing protein [Roseateles sp. DAIF2]
MNQQPARLARQQALLHAAICGNAELLQAWSDGPGLDVYRQAYRARLLAALRDNYLVLQRALGDAAFDALGLAYLAARPSMKPSIRWFGDGLADFMSSAWPALPHPALVDLARMDWALRAAFDAADAAPLDAQALRELPPEAWPTLRFAAHPSVRLLELDWAIEAAWRRLREADPEQGAEALPAPEPLRHHLLVWREALETRWRSLPALDALLLGAVLDGQDFDAVCQLAERQLGAEQAAPAVVTLLQQWLAAGLLLANTTA